MEINNKYISTEAFQNLIISVFIYTYKCRYAEDNKNKTNIIKSVYISTT